ncbi:stage VI sporulation protein F [Bacillus tianshenii]|nr:stage VI sporulation protein F [Bacillus tianshenii]
MIDDGSNRSSYDEETIRRVVRHFSEWMNADLSKQEENRIVNEVLHEQKPLDCHTFRKYL